MNDDKPQVGDIKYDPTTNSLYHYVEAKTEREVIDVEWIESLIANNTRLRAALERIAHIYELTSDVYISSELRQVAQIAREALEETAHE